jgi:1,4-alpha-glucan branching enzyme
MENRKDYNALDKPYSVYEVHLGSWKRHEEDNRFLTYLEFAEDLVAYVKKQDLRTLNLCPLWNPYDPSWGIQWLFCTDLSFWQSTRIYGAGRPIASSRNWRYSRLGTFPLPDDAHGLGFLMVLIF